MKLMFWSEAKARVATPAISRYLNSEFRLGPQSLAKLLVLEKNGKFSNRSVKMVRVFDPGLISNGEGAKLKYDDLKINGNQKALRFEGRFEKDGSLYLADRRPAADGPGQDST